MGQIVIGYGAYEEGSTYVYTVEKQPLFEGGGITGVWETLDVFIGTDEGKRLAFERVDRIHKAYAKGGMEPIVRVTKRKVIDR